MASFLPDTDAELLAWAGNFSTLISATPIPFGLSAGQASSFAALFTAFSDAYTTAIEPSTRTKSAITARNSARDALKASARLLSKIIQGHSTVTAAQKVDLGLNVPAPHTPIGAPTTPPVLEVRERLGTWMRILLHDGSGTSRAMPDGVQGARVYSFIGPSAPVDINAWVLEGQTTRAFVDLQFPPTAVAGTVVWLTAQYYNPRGETGPACSPVQTVIAGGAMPEAM